MLPNIYIYILEHEVILNERDNKEINRETKTLKTAARILNYATGKNLMK